ncbi:MAG: DNA polymerase III subunit beta [Gammaproteobacteria bacterium RIFCSPHIGHO2_12_FULL_38_14]|nr:MAG: DNA polymerase III subunit beta [Gammaproteobacteria bacterium RIFCSPHIGHO2_12_FULL_38_14]
MDITVEREALLKPLQALSSIVEKKQTLPILSNILLTVKDNKLLLTGTDMEMELIGSVPLLSETQAGVVTVSARKLCDICRTLPEDATIRMTLEKNYLVVRAGDSYFMLNTLPVETFPHLEADHYALQFKIQQAALKNLLSKTHFAMAQQDVRHYLNGAFLHIHQNKITCVAADGHRLAYAAVTSDHLSDVDTKVILPRKSVLEMIRLLDQEADVNISINDHRFCLTTNDYIFTSKLINAQYPDYNRLVPQGKMIATADREVVKQALVRASILSNEKFRGIRFQLESNALRITANNADQEQAEEAVPLDYSGDPIEIGFNVAYLLDVMSAVTTRMIRCIFTDSNSGVLIQPVDGDDSLYVVMPMRL